jgi:hypothetical protein
MGLPVVDWPNIPLRRKHSPNQERPIEGHIACAIIFGLLAIEFVSIESIELFPVDVERAAEDLVAFH